MERVTLQELVLAVADACRDNTPGVTTSSLTATDKMQDRARGRHAKDKLWEGSQILFHQPAARAAGLTGPNPMDVVGFAVDGTFTLHEPWNNSTGVPAGIHYSILRGRGQGAPYRQYLAAIRYAVKKFESAEEVTDTALLTASDTFEYIIPDGIDVLYDVVLTSPTRRYPVPPNQWDTAQGRRLIFTNRRLDVGSSYTIELAGLQYTRVPTELDETLYIPYTEVVDLASERLLVGSVKPQDAGRAGNLTQERIRFNEFGYIYSNAREVR